jgi:hypothetical protein
MMNFRKYYLILAIFIFGIFVFGAAVPSQADETWSYTFNDLNPEEGIYYPDGSGSGWIYLTVTNNTGSIWSDFHFEIFDIGMGSIANVDFLSGGANGPFTSQNPFTYTIDNTSVGAKLDFYFIDDLIPNGDLATFNVNISNPDNSTYGVIYRPTVIPEPISSMLFLVGAATLGARRYWKKRQTA